MLPAKREVVSKFRMDNRRPRGQSLFRVRDYRERLVFHLNQIERIPRGIPILRDYGGDSLAGETDFAGGEDVMRGDLERWVVRGSRQCADFVFELRAGANRDYTGKPARRVGVKFFDLRVGVGAS